MLSYKKSLLFILMITIFSNGNGLLSSLYTGSSRISAAQRKHIEKEISETKKSLESYKYGQAIYIFTAAIGSIASILYGYGLFKEGPGINDELLISTMGSIGTVGTCVLGLAALHSEKNQDERRITDLQKKVQESSLNTKK